jgi:hypothetical protein
MRVPVHRCRTCTYNSFSRLPTQGTNSCNEMSTYTHPRIHSMRNTHGSHARIHAHDSTARRTGNPCRPRGAVHTEAGKHGGREGLKAPLVTPNMISPDCNVTYGASLLKTATSSTANENTSARVAYMRCESRRRSPSVLVSSLRRDEVPSEQHQYQGGGYPRDMLSIKHCRHTACPMIACRAVAAAFT